MKTISTRIILLMVAVLTIINGCNHGLSGVDRPTDQEVPPQDQNADSTDFAASDQYKPPPDLKKQDSTLDHMAPTPVAVLVKGGIGTAVSTSTSMARLLDGTFETGKILCPPKMNACLIGGIEP